MRTAGSVTTATTDVTDDGGSISDGRLNCSKYGQTVALGQRSQGSCRVTGAEREPAPHGEPAAVRHLVDTGAIVSTYVEWMMLRPEDILTLRVRSRDTGVVMA